MPRRLRIEFEGAIYHVMARGNARQKIVRDDVDRRRLIDGLDQTVVRCGWELLSYVVMGNHLHLLVKTPRPNLGAGMQSFLSGYAIWAGRRWRRPGHLFQGRYRTEMIEDESYYWTVSRYIHLNPVRAGLVSRPEQWEWSSYPGYRDARRAQALVAHDVLLAAWPGDQAGRDVRKAYVRFVEAGLADPPPPPFREAFGGWVLGSERFVDRLRRLAGERASNPPLAEARQLGGLDPKRIFAAVADYLRTGLRIDVAAARPAPGAGGRRLALPPSHRGVTTRVGRVAGPFASRQRAQSHTSARSESEDVAGTVQRSQADHETGDCPSRRHPAGRTEA